MCPRKMSQVGKQIIIARGCYLCPKNHFLEVKCLLLPLYEPWARRVVHNITSTIGCSKIILLVIRHQRNHMAAYMCVSLFDIFFPISETQQQQQQKFWKHNTKTSKCITREFVSISKRSGSTKTEHDLKQAMGYSWIFIIKPPNQ